MRIDTPNRYIKIANYIEKNKFIQRTLHYADKNPSAFQATSVFILASIIRPSTIMAVPNKTKDGKKDSLYSASRSIITGALDLGTAFAIFMPLNKAIDKAGRVLFNTQNTAYWQNKERCSAFKSLFNRGVKIAILPAMAYFNFAYVKQLSDVISKKIFKGDKK